MVRYIERKAFLGSSYLYRRPGGFLSEPLVIADLPWGRMVRRKKGCNVVREINTIVLPPGETLDDMGYWRDTEYFHTKGS